MEFCEFSDLVNILNRHLADEEKFSLETLSRLDKKWAVLNTPIRNTIQEKISDADQRLNTLREKKKEVEFHRIRRATLMNAARECLHLADVFKGRKKDYYYNQIKKLTYEINRIYENIIESNGDCEILLREIQQLNRSIRSTIESIPT